MRPAKELRTGNVYRAARVWCAIDTLLLGQCKTIAEVTCRLGGLRRGESRNGRGGLVQEGFGYGWCGVGGDRRCRRVSRRMACRR